MQLRIFNKKAIHRPTADDDPVLPNYLALLACILHKKLTVAKALTLMEINARQEPDDLMHGGKSE